MSPTVSGSPPPAYGEADHARGKSRCLGSDEKVSENGRFSGDLAVISVGDNRGVDHRERSDSDLGARSEETVTPQSHLNISASQRATGHSYGDDEDVRPLGLTTTASQYMHPSGSEQPRLATPPSSSPFRLHLSTPSRTENDISRLSEASPPPSPVTRPPPKAPRLSLHVDMDNDLSSWSQSLFSVLESSETTTSSSPNLDSFGSKYVAAPSTRATSSASHFSRSTTSPNELTTTPKKSAIPPLVLSSPARSVLSEADQSIDGTSPLFDEVMSLVQCQSPVSNGKEEDDNGFDIDASALLVPTRPSSTYLSNTSSPPPLPQFNYEFLKFKPDRSSSISQPSSRDSQATISSSSRWSKATVTTVRDATIARATKPAMANAAAVPAPMPTRHGQTPSTSSMSNISADLTGSSVDSSSILDGSALDFPMPPPSPLEGSFMPSSGPTSPRLPPPSPVDPVRASMTGVDGPLGIGQLPTASTSNNRLPSPSSTRSSQSSSSVSSTYSSQANPLSITSCSESSTEGADEEDDTISRLTNAVRIELRSTDSEGSFLSPTDSEAGSRKWAKEQAKHISMRRSVYSNPSDDADGLYYGVDDGGTPVVDWLTDSPTSPHFEMHGNVKRDSVAVFNHLQRNPSLQQGVQQGILNRNSQDSRNSQDRRPSIQINGTAALDVRRSSQKLLTPFVGDLTPSPISANSSPMQRYRGWVSEILAPLEEYINHDVDPRKLFSDMQEIAEGESGSVFVAKVVARPSSAKKSQVETGEVRQLVAIKNVPLVPGGSSKLLDLEKELAIMSRIRHENILSMEALYVDLAEDCLWIEMELMERSLADMLALAEEGLMLLEPMVARFTKDVSSSVESAVLLVADNVVHYRYLTLWRTWKTLGLPTEMFALTICWSTVRAS